MSDEQKGSGSGNNRSGARMARNYVALKILGACGPVAILFFLFGLIIVVIVASVSGSSSSGGCSTDDKSTTGPVPVVLHFGGVTIDGKPLNTQQKGIALIIVGVVKARNMSRRDAKLALMVAIQESNLTVLDHGDTRGPDSRGPYQQRHPWGPLEVRMDPAGSTNLFLNALIQVTDRDSLSLLDEAIAVQHPLLSAYLSPQHYFMSWEAPVEQMLGTTYDDPGSLDSLLSSSGCTSAIPGSADYAYPLGKVGTIIGCPFQGTHTNFKNWQSDNALDLATPTGTPVFAVANGVIGPRIGSINSADPHLGGLRVTVETTGNDFYYQHLSQLSVTAGQAVTQGQIIGFSGSSSGVEHLHLGMHALFNPARAIGLSPNLCPDNNWAWPSWLPRDNTSENGSPLQAS